MSQSILVTYCHIKKKSTQIFSWNNYVFSSHSVVWEFKLSSVGMFSSSRVGSRPSALVVSCVLPVSWLLLSRLVSLRYMWNLTWDIWLIQLWSVLSFALSPSGLGLFRREVGVQKSNRKCAWLQRAWVWKMGATNYQLIVLVKKSH